MHPTKVMLQLFAAHLGMSLIAEWLVQDRSNQPPLMNLEALLPFDHLILYLFNHHSEFILANLLMTCPAIGSIAWPHIPPDRFQSL